MNAADSADNPLEASSRGSIGEHWLRAWQWLRPLASLAFFLFALWLLHHEFRSLKASDIAAALRGMPSWKVVAALLLTACSYVVLTGYDWLGVRLVNHPMSTKQTAIASSLSFAFSNCLGTIFGSTPIRFRLYSAWGLTSPEIVRLITFVWLAFWIGLCSLGGILFVLTPLEIPTRFNLPIASSRPLGFILLGVAFAYFAACGLRREPLHLLSVNFQPPSLKIGFAQAAVAICDFLLAAATLYVLLPQDMAIGFLPFAAIFVLAIIVAMVSNVPGGLGVLELVMITMLPNSSDSLVASLLAFRVIYYLVPLLIAVIGISVATIRQHHHRASTIASVTAHWANAISPRIITGAVFVAGLVLLISGSLPAGEGRMQLLRQVVPLPLIEVSHFLGSIIGALLLVLARGLHRRIDVAWTLTVGLLGIGAIVSLVKGCDWEEAIVLTSILLAMIPCRKTFCRRGRLFAPTFKLGWVVAIGMSLGLLSWLMLFAYGHVEYSSELWWAFAYDGDAPRSLRALVGVAVVLSLVAVAHLIRSRPEAPNLPTDQELAEAAKVVRSSESTNANLALIGDKRFLFSADRKAFVMFGCEGSSWISMGDPVGPADSADDAAWSFCEACDAAGVHPVFYQVDESSLGRYVEMGFALLKLGEEARVPLHDFSLEGSSRKDLRRTKKKSAEAGLRFEIVGQANVPELMPQLRAISDTWLGEKSTAEKGFSLGYFHEPYLRSCDMAMVYEGDRPIAFANLWKGANQHELSIDLMRYLPDSSRNVMEYLFVELMLYGHDQGYEWFSLGMAPLFGVDPRRLGPVWNRVSDLVYRHGEHFYNFQGLRSYKEKFKPVWFPKYLASPGGLATPQVLANVSTLIAGGVTRLLHR